MALPTARPILEAVMDAALGFANQPRPTDVPRVYAPGPDADRLILIGTSAVAGVGVASHQLGLGGYLARRISTQTGRGVDLEIEGSTTLTVTDAIHTLTSRTLSEYDVVVLMLGYREAIRFQPMRVWKPNVMELLATVTDAELAPHVFVVATPPVDRYATLPSTFVARLSAQLDRQNQVTASVCARTPGAEFLPVTVPGDRSEYLLNSATYESWAGLLAPPIATWLDANPHRSRGLAHIDEESRQAALDALKVIGSPPEGRFDRIAQTARDLLGASGASIIFLDGDRQWIKSAISMSTADTARANSFCNTTITRQEVFVVEDAQASDEFAGHPWVIGRDGVRFYAGYPIEAPNGERVGALCVVDTKPRTFSRAEASLLRELAIRVQSLLWAG